MPAKKKSTAKKATKKVAKKTSAKKAVTSQPTKKKASAKKKTAPTKKTAAKKKVNTKKAPSSPKPDTAAESTETKEAVVSRSKDSSDKKPARVAFSMDDIEQLVAAKKSQEPGKKEATPEKPKIEKPKVDAPKKIIDEKPAEKRVHAPASMADILGFNPAEKKRKVELGDGEVPKKWKKYYRLLIELRAHMNDEISLHTSETLKHSSRDDSGDLSSYGTHQADAGTDTFDRDFALSLVSGEQEALYEIEEAILRIKNGTYGLCEVTGKPIPAARLTAVPFARYSVEGQIEHEKNKHRKNQRQSNVGIFGDVSDMPKLESGDDDE